MDIDSWLITGKKYFLYFVLIVFSAAILATEQTSSELELSAIAEFSSVQLQQDEWHTVMPITGSEDEYFLTTKNGKVYSLKDQQINNTPLLDLSSRLKKNIVSLTAIAQDPSFNFRDRTGYNTFYTAHIESTTKQNENTQDQAQVDESATLPYDTVIMRWQLRKPLNQATKIVAQHEVIRIAIHNKAEAIRQLSFNPYTESWHDDFGLLYALLPKTKNALKSAQAIYSGTILRIKPERFGLQSYTIPANNPFIKKADIRNEIALIVNENVVSFDWVKKTENSLLIQVKNAQGHSFIQTKLGEDWRIDGLPEPNKLTNTSSIISSQAILYHGRELKNLWGQILQLNQVENGWQLQVLTSDTSHPAQVLSTLNQDNISQATATGKFSLHKNYDNELLLLEHNRQRLYAVKAAQVAMKKTAAASEPIASSNDSNNGVLTFLVIVALVVSCLWYIRFNSKKQQHFLYQQWANFDVNAATQTLSLYKRHNHSVEQIVKLSSLKRSELLLNDEIISIVSVDAEHGFSNALEEQLQIIFAKEHRFKMIDGKQRKIQLRLSDDENSQYLFCLYYRVGNVRHTKLKYNKVLKKVIDWHWLFAQYINAENTDKRKIRVKLAAEKTSDIVNSKSQPPPALKQEKTEQIDGHMAAIASTSNKADSLKLNNAESSNQDNELIAALDKLIEMKKQGYLSEDEFNTAKAKILKSLANELNT